jgi:Polycystin cation channel
MILAIVVVGFANAFYVILSKGPSTIYSTPYYSVRSAFAYMLGGYDLSELDDGPAPIVSSLLWVVFMIIVAVVLLNVLIAIISDSFERLVASSLVNFRLEKCKIVLSSHYNLSATGRKMLSDYLQKNPNLHVLKPSATAEAGDEWAGRVGAIVTQVKAALAANNLLVTSSVDTMKTAVTAVKTDVSKMKTDVASVNTAVTAVKADVQSVRKEVAALQSSINKTHALLEQLLANTSNR